jgi:hypothetical protein
LSRERSGRRAISTSLLDSSENIDAKVKPVELPSFLLFVQRHASQPMITSNARPSNTPPTIAKISHVSIFRRKKKVKNGESSKLQIFLTSVSLKNEPMDTALLIVSLLFNAADPPKLE